MSSKKRDASSWGVAGPDDYEGPSSTINDPVYSQLVSSPPQPGSHKSWTRPSTASEGATKDDPVYSQANVAGDDQEGQPASQIIDPVYGQPAESEAKPQAR